MGGDLLSRIAADVPRAPYAALAAVIRIGKKCRFGDGSTASGCLLPMRMAGAANCSRRAVPPSWGLAPPADDKARMPARWASGSPQDDGTEIEMHLPPLRSIGVFYQLGRLNSVSKAAEYLGVTPSAISQQIRTLEEQLGTTLVRKVGREVRLTETGERYFEMIAENIENIWQATRQVTGARSTELLNIRATPSVSTKWLLPKLPRFAEENPGLDMRLDGSNEPVDFTRDNVDIEIRHGEGRWPGLHVQPLAREHFVPVCSPRLAGAGSLSAADLQSMRRGRS